jgi:branched-chain amino acid transport system permease protein
VLEWLSANQFFIDITLIMCLLVLSVFVVFQAGIFSLGSVGFMALGAYTTAILTTREGLPMGAGIAAAAVLTALAGLVIGLIVLRLEGIYLALATLALGQAVIVLIETLGITGGDQGIIGIPSTYTTWIDVVLLIVVVAVLELVHRSHHGRAIHILRADPVIARSLGIRVRGYKLVALSASGLLAGLAGALNAHEVGSISPDQYNFSLLVTALTYAVVGGVAYWAGPVIAAIALGLLDQFLHGSGTTIETAVYGFVLIGLMFVAPLGLGDPRLRRLAAAVRRRRPVPGTAALEETRQ